MGSADIESELTNLLRSISSRRRHGVLTIERGEYDYEIAFHNGRIIEARRSDKPAAAEICHRLEASGHPLGAVLDKLSGVDLTLADLCAHLHKEGKIPIEDLRNAKTSYDLDVLHSLAKLGPARFDFQQQMVAVNDELTLDMSTGQLLLDLVDVQDDSEQFSKKAGDLHSASRWAVAKGELGGNASETEKRVWKLVEEGKSFAALSGASLMSEYDLRRTLLSLHERELISFSDSAPAPKEPKAQGKKKEKKAEALSKERAADLVKKTGVTLRDTTRVFRDELALREDEVFDELVDEASRLLTVMSEAKESSPQNSAPLAQKSASQQTSTAQGKERKAPAADPAEAPAGNIRKDALALGPATAPQSSDPPPPHAAEDTSFRSTPVTQGTSTSAAPEILPHQEKTSKARHSLSHFHQLSYLIQDETVASRISAGIVILFLVSVAFYLSTVFLSWFDAVSQFSNSQYGGRAAVNMQSRGP